MSNFNRTISFVVTLLGTLSLSAQNPNLALEQRYVGDFIVSVNAGYDLGSNAVTSKFANTFYSGGYLDQDIKDKAFNKLKSKNRLGLDFTYNLNVLNLPDSNAGKKSWGYFIEWNNVIHADAGFTEDLFRLYFAGNKAYAGQTAELSNTSFNYLAYKQLKGGFIKNTKNGRFGIGLSIVQDDDYASGKIERGSLFTAEEGTALELDSKLELRAKQDKQFSYFEGAGYGGTIDFFYLTELNEKSNLSFELRDIGFIAWNNQSETIVNDTNLRFEGIEVENLLDISDSLLNGYTENTLDTLGATQSKGAFNSFFPGYIMVNYSNQLKDNMILRGGANYRFNANYFPYLYLGADFLLSEKMRLSSKLSYGGYAGLGLGLGLDASITKFLDLRISTNHLEGYLLTNAATAQGVYLNLLGHF